MKERENRGGVRERKREREGEKSSPTGLMSRRMIDSPIRALPKLCFHSSFLHPSSASSFLRSSPSFAFYPSISRLCRSCSLPPLSLSALLASFAIHGPSRRLWQQRSIKYRVNAFQTGPGPSTDSSRSLYRNIEIRRVTGESFSFKRLPSAVKGVSFQKEDALIESHGISTVNGLFYFPFFFGELCCGFGSC